MVDYKFLVMFLRARSSGSSDISSEYFLSWLYFSIDSEGWSISSQSVKAGSDTIKEL